MGRLARFRYREDDQRYTTIPNHPVDLPEGTLRAILRQAGVVMNFLTADGSDRYRSAHAKRDYSGSDRDPGVDRQR